MERAGALCGLFRYFRVFLSVLGSVASTDDMGAWLLMRAWRLGLPRYIHTYFV